MAVAGGSDLLQRDLLGLDVPRPNLLRNGDFRDASAGTTFAAPADGTNTLSGWYVLTAGAGAVNVAQEIAVVPRGAYAAWRATVTATNNLKFGVIGFVLAEDTVALAGGTASLAVTARASAGSTLSFLRAAVLSWTGAADAVTVDVVSAWNAAGVMPTFVANYTLENVAQNMPLTSSYTTFRTAAIPIDTAGAKNVAVFLWSDDVTTTAGDILYVADVSLVAGPQPANIERRRRVSIADIADGVVIAAKIADGAVTTAKILDGTILAGDIADGAVTSAKILDGTIAAIDIADGAITTAKILDATILAGDLADGAVTSAKILDGTIATGDIAASATSQAVVSNTASGQTTTSTTLVEVDATNSSVTITPVIGTTLLVLVQGSVSNNTATAYTAFAMFQDGASLGELLVSTSAVANAYGSFGGGQLLSSTAGVATTIRLRWRVSSGTATMNAAKFCVVELKR